MNSKLQKLTKVETVRYGPLENLWGWGGGGGAVRGGGGGGGGGAGRSTNEYSRKGKFNEKKFMHAN